MKTLARSLRQNSTDAERLLWKHLRSRQLENFKFRRQVPIEPYIVDFVCLEAKLIVEADGGQHLDNKRDTQRDDYLKAHGYRILRFWNHEILNQTTSVLEQIYNELVLSPHPNPSPEERGA